MGQTVEIRRFTTQYHLRPSQFDSKSTGSIVCCPEVVGSALELALERAGIRENEVVCIRSVYVPIRLRLSRADSALAAEWCSCWPRPLRTRPCDTVRARWFSSRWAPTSPKDAYIGFGRGARLVFGKGVRDLRIAPRGRWSSRPR